MKACAHIRKYRDGYM